jgi:cytochrome oxidase Cu insertion factor (SCO1/SenC/PrrC family)
MSLRGRMLVAAIMLATLVVAFARSVPAAHADGDPASDYLYAASAFVPYDAEPNSSAANELGALVQKANRAGYEIRVALIASREDLGSDTPLWLKPQQYANFLGTELSLVYHGELLVLMPNGLGIFHSRQSADAQRRLLATIEPSTGKSALERTAISALRVLARADGHPLPAAASAPAAPGAASSSSPPAQVILLLALDALPFVGAFVWLTIALRRRWLRRRTQRAQPTAGRRRLLLPALLGAAGLLLVGGGVAFAMLGSGARSPAGVSNATTQLMGLFQYPKGHFAPNFTLTDQRGRQYSLSSFRGDVVVLEFTDSRCTNLCPIISHEYVVAAQALGRTNSHVEFVSVNVNLLHDKISDVARYSSEHGLENLPNWHFLTGSPAQLSAVWRRYDIDVTLNKDGEVEHGAPMLFINRQGEERWLASPDYNQAQINDWGAGIAQVARLLL